jgi:hypothetical protein
VGRAGDDVCSRRGEGGWDILCIYHISYNMI